MASSKKSSSGKFKRLQLSNGLEIGVIVLLVLLFLNLLSWPVAIADESLDGSWQAILTYSLEHGLRFGEEVVFTYGPLGSLSSFSYSGYNHAGKYGFELLMRISMVVFIFRFLPNVRPYSKIGFILLYLFILQFLPNSYETFFFFGLLSWVAALVLERRKKKRAPWALIALGVVFIVFCSLVKFTLLLAGVYCLGLVSIFLCLHSRIFEAVVLVTGYLIGFLLLWLSLGQQVSDIPGFLYGSSQVANGYAMSMQIATEPEAFKYFLLFLISGITLVGIVLRDQLRGGFKRIHLKQPWLILLAVYSGLFFMVWKQGVVRSDGHIWQFFCYVPLAGWFLYPVVKKRISWLLFDGIIIVQTVLMVAAMVSYYPGFLGDIPQRFWTNTREGVGGLLKPSDLLNGFREQLEAKKTALLKQHSLLNHVGDRSVDVVGNRQGLVIIPGFQYQPRPVFQNYVANNAYLQDLNFAYWDSVDTPEVVIQSLEAIDGVSPTHADSQTLLHLLSHYQLEETSGDLVLLNKRTIPSLLHRDEEKEYPLQFEESIILEPSSRRFLIGRVDMPLNILGRLRAFLYKPPILSLSIELEDGSVRDFRFNPVTAKRDFILSPVVDTALDLWRFRQGLAGPRVEKLTIRTDPGEGLYFSGKSSLTVIPVEWRDPE
ncbi:MAG: hypothetical protein O7C75_05330 [Verrucomicrobia bacterium]|nr:hypothetical protein [Verrucomicrobiota bacterium]